MNIEDNYAVCNICEQLLSKKAMELHFTPDGWICEKCIKTILDDFFKTPASELLLGEIE